jgi:hypothetical protein
MAAISFSTPAINSVTLKTVHHAPVIQMVKQAVQLLNEKYIEM